jgi:linoleoyl-CoA desaturase
MKTTYIKKPDETLNTDLRKAVSEYFKSNYIDKHGGNKILTKSIFFLFSLSLIYTLLLTTTNNSLLLIIMYCSLIGVTFPLIGFNIMHDASHESFSKNKKLNDLMGHSLDLMGASMLMWKIKHVKIHHYNTNTTHDDDLNAWPILRLHKNDKWLWFHQYQHFYGPFVYGLLYFSWVFINDFQKIRTSKIHTLDLTEKDVPKNYKWRLRLVKAIYLTIFLFIPMFILSWWKVLIGYLLMCFVCGVIISFVFQLAHVVESTEQFVNDTLHFSWAEAQVRSTANFSTGNKFLTYILGGLNFQLEHHLFPDVSHVHYPKIQPIVKSILKKHNLEYKELPFSKAIISHMQTLKKLGSKK